MHRNNKCGFKGVYLHKGKFIARVTHKGIQSHLGCFDSPVDAAHAYDRAAKRVFGRFANTNLMQGKFAKKTTV
jgi:hypothetical protein